MTAPTQATAREAVELPEPDAFQGLKLVPFEYRWFHVRENATKLGYDIEKVYFSEETVRALLAAKQEEVDKMREALTDVCKFFPTDTDMAEAGWFAAEIAVACRVYDKARAALSPSQQGEARE